MWAHSGEWARGSQLGLRDLQLLECCIPDDVEAGPTVDQHVIEPHVGYDRSGKCHGVANHSRVAECTRLSPEGEYSGLASA